MWQGREGRPIKTPTLPRGPSWVKPSRCGTLQLAVSDTHGSCGAGSELGHTIGWIPGLPGARRSYVHCSSPLVDAEELGVESRLVKKKTTVRADLGPGAQVLLCELDI
jgi:hypothetical protein